MDNNMCSCAETLAIATVPKQEWCEPYDWETALYEGTIFPCLNLLFYKAPMTSKQERMEAKPINNEAHDRECMLNEINAISFAINDLTLYLDTHPDCPDGTRLYYQLLQKRMDLLADFATLYYPLTAISMVTGDYDTNQYGWQNGPMPWEGAYI